MRVLLAPDKFKGSLSALDVARHLAAGLQAGSPDIEADWRAAPCLKPKRQ